MSSDSFTKVINKMRLQIIYIRCMKIAEKNNQNRQIYYDVKSTLNVSVLVTITRTWISE